jgi:hypothetical protein
VMISGTGGTLVNGKKSETITVPAQFGIHTDFGGGNDDLKLIGVNAGFSDLWMGDGDDRVTFWLSKVNTLKVEGGGGVDSVTTTTSKVNSAEQHDVP